MTTIPSPTNKYRVGDKVAVRILQRGGFIPLRGIVHKCVYDKGGSEYLVVNCTSNEGLEFIIKGYASKLLIEHEK